MVTSLQRNDLAVTYAAIDMINSLMHSMNADYDLKQEQLNKSSLISSKNFLEKLLDMWTKHVVSVSDVTDQFFDVLTIKCILDSRQWCIGSVSYVGLFNFCSLCSL